MKTEITMKREGQLTRRVASFIDVLVGSLMLPIGWFRSYYSSCLGKEISLRQTFSLLHVQIAFLFAVFATGCSVLLHVVFIAWFAAALVTIRIS